MGRQKGSRNPPGSKKPGPRPGTKREEWYERTLQEVGDELGVCRERVRQIEVKALAKLRAGLLARGITEELWLSHLADLHKRQKSVYTVSTSYITVRSNYDGAEEEVTTCNAEQSE